MSYKNLEIWQLAKQLVIGIHITPDHADDDHHQNDEDDYTLIFFMALHGLEWVITMEMPTLS